MRIILTEAKADYEKLVGFAGQELADKFIKIKPRLKSPENDIYYWLKKTPEELNQFINDTLSKKTNSEKEQEAREGAELVAENEYYKVYYITTFEASKKYGAHTKWCITGSQSGWTDETNENKYWRQYNDEGVKMYFFIPKTKDNMKYALALYPDGENKEIFDETDEQVDIIPYAPDVDGVYSSPKLELNIKDGVLIGSKNVFGHVDIPNGVTSIGINAFFDCSDLTSITIPDGVISIGDSAFSYCSKLTNITIPNSVTSIGQTAFSYCDGLTSITIPFVGNTKDEPSDVSFKYIFGSVPNSLKTVVLTGGTSIGVEAFYGCSELTSITIPNSVESIGERAFCWCGGLTSITIPDSVTSVGKGAFCGCTGLPSIMIPKSVTNIEGGAFCWCRAVNCEVESKPNGWEENWDYGVKQVNWGVKSKTQESLEESLKNGPMMIRRDGKVFTNLPGNMHPYGTDGPEYALDYCPWLYHSTSNESTRELIIKFLSQYCCEEVCDLNELFEMNAPLDSKEYKSFVSEIGDQIDYITEFEDGSYEKSWRMLEEALNNEFLRTRYGGGYNGGDTGKFDEIVFRVSSKGFNWFNNIYMFVTDNKRDIGFVTIAHDREVTGDDSPYVHKGIPFSQMPIDEFLTISGNPDIS